MSVLLPLVVPLEPLQERLRRHRHVLVRDAALDHRATERVVREWLADESAARSARERQVVQLAIAAVAQVGRSLRLEASGTVVSAVLIDGFRQEPVAILSPQLHELARAARGIGARSVRADGSTSSGLVQLELAGGTRVWSAAEGHMQLLSTEHSASGPAEAL